MRIARWLSLFALGASPGTGCYIVQDPDPAYPTGAAGPPAPDQAQLAASAAVIEGDGTLDSRSIAAAVAAVRTALAGCFGAPGQVELVVRMDAEGRPVEVQGPGDAACLLEALRGASLPRPAIPTAFRVALWVEGARASQEGAREVGSPPQEGAREVGSHPQEASPPEGPAPAPAAASGEVFLVTIASLRVDPVRVDGRPWDEGRGAPPDLFVRLVRNGEEVLRTATVADSPSPTFDSEAGRSLKLGPADQIVFEIHDDDPGAPELLTRFRVPAPGPSDLERGSWEIGPSPPMQRLSIRLAPPRTLVGTGVRWGRRHGSLRVLEVAPDSPAARAGVQPGDVIVSVDGQRARTLSVEELEGLFRGAVGSRIRLGLDRGGGQGLQVELERAIVYY